MNDETERRRSRRFPVTLSASINDARRSYRGEVLDVGDGGLLLSAPEDFRVEPGAALTVEAAMIGCVEAYVVATSKHGIHLQVRDSPARYASALQKLSRLTRAWR